MTARVATHGRLTQHQCVCRAGHRNVQGRRDSQSPTDDGGIEIAGISSYPSRGMKRGVVINIESTVLSIQRAVEEAELMAGYDILGLCGRG